MSPIDVGLVLLGLVLLVGGGELLVRGASGLALLARVSPAVVGLTVVAAGTSMPELVVSIQAAVRESPGLAVGNVVGSNIFNIAAILGIAALVSPLRIQGNTVRLEWPVMLLATCQLYLLARDGIIDRLEGGFLFLGLVAFVLYTVWIARRELVPVEREELESEVSEPTERGGRAWAIQGGLTLVGAAILIAGAHALVTGATEIARGAGISEAVIGLTVVAAGTSLPELAASAVASFRGKDDIAIANVLGSNIFNALGIGGATALVYPLPVPAEIIARDGWWMIGFSVLLFPLMRTGMKVSRAEGALLLVGFAAYMAALFGAF